MRKSCKSYETPVLSVMLLTDADVLTLSAGFDGEDHEFELPMP